MTEFEWQEYRTALNVLQRWWSERANKPGKYDIGSAAVFEAWLNRNLGRQHWKSEYISKRPTSSIQKWFIKDIGIVVSHKDISPELCEMYRANVANVWCFSYTSCR